MDRGRQRANVIYDVSGPSVPQVRPQQLTQKKSSSSITCSQVGVIERHDITPPLLFPFSFLFFSPPIRTNSAT